MSEYPDNWGALRQQVFQRDGFECQNCGYSPKHNSDSSLHAHHVVPMSNGGLDHLRNLTSLCSDCHAAAHNKTKAPTYSPEKYNQTLDSFSLESQLRSYLNSKYGADDVVDQILGQLDLDPPISYEKFEQAEKNGLKEWFSREIDTETVGPLRREMPKEYQYLAAVEIENLRE